MSITRRYRMVWVLLIILLLPGCAVQKTPVIVPAQTEEQYKPYVEIQTPGKQIKEISEQSKWKTYTDKDLGIEFSYPSTWEPVDPTKIGMYPSPVLLVIDLDSVNGFGTNVNLTVQQSPMLAPSAEEQVKQTELYTSMLTSMGMSDYRRISFYPVDIDIYKAGVVDGEFVISQTGTKLRNRQLIVPVGSKTFTLTMTTDKQSWDKNESTFKEIVKSFKLIK